MFVHLSIKEEGLTNRRKIGIIAAHYYLSLMRSTFPLSSHLERMHEEANPSARVRLLRV